MMGGSQDFPFGIMDVASLLRLNIRRRQPNSVYADCPFCGDKRGKMNLNHVKNVWRCNYCGESGGMVALYAKVYGISNSDAYREICDTLQTGNRTPDYETKTTAGKPELDALPQSELAGIAEIHQTISLLLGMLTLSAAHRGKLWERGLTDEQIDSLGYKSTPPPYLCLSYTERLLKQGCTVQGVPGFYLNEDGKWTVKFHKRTAGILIPAKGIDGLIRGAQIRLDVPMKDKDDDPEKEGTKYLWLSSSNKNMGVTSGSPVHFVGDPLARTVYVTEGILKADVAHCLMNRTFAAIAGANNTGPLDPLFALLAYNGTQLIVEAEDMDKFRNEHVVKGTSKIYLMAHKYKMDSRRLTWNPNYKGIDDWQLALKKKSEQKKEDCRMNFKERFLSGECGIEAIDDDVEAWHTTPEDGQSLVDYLGLTEQEYGVYVRENDIALEKLLLSQRKQQKFRIYQLEFGNDIQPKPFAFMGLEALHKAGYEQPPAAQYRLVYDGTLFCGIERSETDILELLYCRYSEDIPADYHGRSVSPSDVIELHDGQGRRYFYRDLAGFAEVKFSPVLALPMKRQ